MQKEKTASTIKPKNLKGYTFRFALLHIITYWVVGMLMYQLTGYEEALSTMEVFKLYRPLESLLMVLAVFFGQVLRGPILALLLYPFYHTYIQKKQGWLLLFGLLFGLTVLGSPIFIPELLVFDTSFVEYFKTLTIGVPEILVQILLFSFLFFHWQKRVHKNKSKV